MPTLSPQGLRKVLDVLARAQLSVAESVQINGSLQTLVQLASQDRPIGVIPVAEQPADVVSG